MNIVKAALAALKGHASGGEIKPAAATEDVPMQLSEGLFVPSGHDPYGPHLADGECVLSTKTGRCIRDHPGPHVFLPVADLNR